MPNSRSCPYVLFISGMPDVCFVPLCSVMVVAAVIEVYSVCGLIVRLSFLNDGNFLACVDGLSLGVALLCIDGLLPFACCVVIVW